jgi:hypothetical protein
MNEVYEMAVNGSLFSMPVDEKETLNYSLYEELLGENYAKSYCNPTYAVEVLGSEYGAFLAALRGELRSLIAYAFEKNSYDMVIRMELFLEIYGWFAMEEQPALNELQESFSSFAFDYQEDFMEEAVISSFTTENVFCKNIVCNSDLSKLDYLYDYGEYISDNEKIMSAYMASLNQDTIQLIADTFTEGYRKGFETTGKDITIKKTVNIRYFIGFERVVKAAIENFDLTAGYGYAPGVRQNAVAGKCRPVRTELALPDIKPAVAFKNDAASRRDFDIPAIQNDRAIDNSLALPYLGLSPRAARRKRPYSARTDARDCRITRTRLKYGGQP